MFYEKTPLDIVPLEVIKKTGNEILEFVKNKDDMSLLVYLYNVKMISTGSCSFSEDEYNYFHDIYTLYWRLNYVLRKQFIKEFSKLNDLINEQGENCKIKVNTDMIPWHITVDKDIKNLDVKFQGEMEKLIIKSKRELIRELKLKQSGSIIKSIYM